MPINLATTFEIILGVTSILVLSVFAYLAGSKIQNQSGDASASPLCFASSLLFTIVFAWSFSDNLGWALIVPVASVHLWTNLTPLLLAFTAGLASNSQGLGLWQRRMTVASLLILSIGYTVTPWTRQIIAPVDFATETQWAGNICLQTSESTCAPAAAVTLLRSAGIESTERELSAACFTSQLGTAPLGLYRGLSTASAPTNHRPRVASPHPEVWNQRGQLPNIALVQFSSSEGLPQNQRTIERILGPKGEGHAVVVLGRNADGSWNIADPAFGKTRWTSEQLRSRFTGEAIYLASN